MIRFRIDSVPRPAVIAALLVALFMSAPVAAVELKVMSFNVRYSRGAPQEPVAENDWADATFPRRERAIRVVRDYMPDVLGVQEARDLQVKDMQAALPEFDFYGIGRDDGKTEGEYSGIFYRKDRFVRVDAGSFWLSATPEKPGTTFYKAPDAVPRIASWVRLVDKESRRELFVLNMHWDHIDVPARRQSARLARERLDELAEGLPAIVMGDLNTPENSKPVVELMGSVGSPGRQLADSYRRLHPDRSPDESTFNHWRGTKAGSRIDFILHTDEFKPIEAAIVRTEYDGRWPSDHYPVTATLRLDNDKKEQ
jgi:endonuclease/exonuclease/phosphatase family metal-dependent hydrolase